MDAQGYTNDAACAHCGRPTSRLTVSGWCYRCVGTEPRESEAARVRAFREASARRMLSAYSTLMVDALARMRRYLEAHATGAHIPTGAARRELLVLTPEEVLLAAERAAEAAYQDARAAAHQAFRLRPELAA